MSRRLGWAVMIPLDLLSLDNLRSVREQGRRRIDEKCAVDGLERETGITIRLGDPEHRRGYWWLPATASAKARRS